MGRELAQQYADANESAIRMIEKIATENGIECDFVPQSAYVYTMQDKYIDKIKDEAVIAEFLGIKPHTLKKYLCPSQLSRGPL